MLEKSFLQVWRTIRNLLCLSLYLYFLDPFALKRNVARSLNSQMVFEYIQERFRTAYKYFACPQRQVLGGCQRNKKASKQGAKLEGAEKKEAAFVNKDEDDGKGDKSQGAQRGHPGSNEGEEPESEDEDGSDPSRKKGEKTLDASLMDLILTEGNISSFSPNGLLDSDEGEEDNDEKNSVPSEDLHYVFDKMIFTGGKVTVMISLYMHVFSISQ